MDQWKNWVVYFSLIAMRDILGDNTLECWRHFVQACRVLCRKKLTMGHVLWGDAHLLQFCKQTQRIFSSHVITPNMHMHCHLRSCIADLAHFMDFGSMLLNNLLGAMAHNNHAIEIQLMDRFLRNNEIFSALLPEQFSEDFLSLFPSNVSHLSGSLAESTSCEHPGIQGFRWTIDDPKLSVDLPKHFFRKPFDQTQINMLTAMYTALYKVPISSLTSTSIFQHYSSVKLNGILFGTHASQTVSSSVAMAVWDTHLFGSLSSMPLMPLPIYRAVRINSFCKHTIYCLMGKQKLPASFFIMV